MALHSHCHFSQNQTTSSLSFTYCTLREQHANEVISNFTSSEMCIYEEPFYFTIIQEYTFKYWIYMSIVFLKKSCKTKHKSNNTLGYKVTCYITLLWFFSQKHKTHGEQLTGNEMAFGLFPILTPISIFSFPPSLSLCHSMLPFTKYLLCPLYFYFTVSSLGSYVKFYLI